MALVFSVGRPFRQGMHTNIMFLVSVCVLSACNCALVVKPHVVVQKYMEVLCSDNVVYYCVFFGFVAINFVVSYCIDHLVLNNMCTSNSLPTSPFNSQHSVSHYKLVEKHLECDPSWPPYSTLL